MDLVSEFFAYVRKREALRQKKAGGSPHPWSDDEILNTWKFTNVHREHDRTTIEFKKIMDKNARNNNKRAILLNAAIFRYFGTWEFAYALGWQKTFKPETIRVVAQKRKDAGERVFTGAYVISPGGNKGATLDIVIDVYLTPLHEASREILKIVKDTNSWQAVSERMYKIPGFGGTGFMTKEVLLDTMLTQRFWLHGGLPDDWNTWCPLGPGGMKGLKRVFPDVTITNSNKLELLVELLSIQQHTPSFLGALSLHDIQFCLCEFDKYERVRLGEGRPRSRYHPPKR